MNSSVLAEALLPPIVTGSTATEQHFDALIADSSSPSPGKEEDAEKEDT
jgi:hypothetical protein